MVIATATSYQKICGTFFTTTVDGTTHATVCSYTRPFRIGVHFDGDENIRTPGIKGLTRIVLGVDWALVSNKALFFILGIVFMCYC